MNESRRPPGAEVVTDHGAEQFLETIEMRGFDLSGGAPEHFPGTGSSFSQRLAYSVGNETVRAFAIRSGLAPATVRKYLRDERTDPGRTALVAMATAAGVSLEWLITGMGAPYLSDTDPMPPDMRRALAASFGRYRQSVGATLSVSEAAADFTRRYNRPGDEEGLYVERVEGLVRVTEALLEELVAHAPGHRAGQNGAVSMMPVPLVSPGEDLPPAIALATRYFEKRWQLKIEDMFMVSVTGAGMAPTLVAGDMVLVMPCADKEILDDGLYVMTSGDSLIVRRLKRRLGDRLVLSADGDGDERWEGSESELRTVTRLLGRVHGLVRRFEG